MSVFACAARGLRTAVATMAARPGLMLLFVAIQCGTNLMRFWLGRVEALSSGQTLMMAVGWLLLIARTFMTQWLHVAAARVIDDARVGWRGAFAVSGTQANWFHGMILVSMATFLLRLWLSQASGGFFTPGEGGMLDGEEVVLLLLGLVITYTAFLPLVPGYFTALLGHGEAASLRWSLRAGLPRLLPALAAALLLATPPAVLRRAMLSYFDAGSPPEIVSTALLDAVLTVVLMMLASAVYWGFYRDAVDSAELRPVEAAR